jgi:putative membrane protein
MLKPFPAVLSLILVTGLPVVGQAQESSPDLSDPEVAHVAVTANTIDIDAGKVALTHAKSEEVKNFANMMIRNHAGVNEKAAALAKELNVTPKDNAVSQSLLKGADESKAKLQPLKGAAFDHAYIDREIAFHQAVLDALDKTLIPNAQNAELKALLEKVRPNVAAHLARAKSIQTGLASKT